MKDIVWDDILSVGVDEIDDDHRRLIDLFNILNHSVKKEADLDYVGAVLEELINCTIWHFSHEERLMLKYGFEEIEDHKSEHRDLVDSVKELQQKIMRTGKLEEKENLEFLEKWLTEHILSTDMRLGSFLVETM